jgi:hypothetical protein
MEDKRGSDYLFLLASLMPRFTSPTAALGHAVRQSD